MLGRFGVVEQRPFFRALLLDTDEDLSALLDAGVRLGCTLQLEELWAHHLARRAERMNCNELPGG